MESQFGKLKKGSSDLKREARKQALGYILAALGLVAGLAWNDAVKAFIDSIFPLGKDSIWARFVYAILVTVAVVTMSMYLIRLRDNGEEKLEEESRPAKPSSGTKIAKSKKGNSGGQTRA